MTVIIIIAYNFIIMGNSESISENIKENNDPLNNCNCIIPQKLENNETMLKCIAHTHNCICNTYYITSKRGDYNDRKHYIYHNVGPIYCQSDIHECICTKRNKYYDITCYTTCKECKYGGSSLYKINNLHICFHIYDYRNKLCDHPKQSPMCMSKKHDCICSKNCKYTKKNICQSEKHRCICNKNNSKQKCQSKKHRCMCNENKSKQKCQSKKHKCICNMKYKFYKCKSTECEKISKWDNICICEDICRNQKNGSMRDYICTSIKHKCVCKNKNSYECKSDCHKCSCKQNKFCKSKKHKCNCKKYKKYSCKSDKCKLQYKCKCQKLGPSSCKSTKHNCVCNKYDSSCQSMKHDCICKNENKCNSDNHKCICLNNYKNNKCLSNKCKSIITCICSDIPKDSNNYVCAALEHECVCIKYLQQDVSIKKCKSMYNHPCICRIDFKNCRKHNLSDEELIKRNITVFLCLEEYIESKDVIKYIIGLVKL